MNLNKIVYDKNIVHKYMYFWKEINLQETTGDICKIVLVNFTAKHIDQSLFLINRI